MKRVEKEDSRRTGNRRTQKKERRGKSKEDRTLNIRRKKIE